MIRVSEEENLEFKWGTKRGIGGKKKDVQFYESFTYDGVEYTLYDSVYMYVDSEPDPPYIGKIIKIWENADKSKKVKILWFFHPCEISNYLQGIKTSENELFMACGDGVGLANVNPLEAIAGKCNVICTSKDSRNPQPSNEELQKADYIFYRLFDVCRHVVLDKIDDKIAQVDVKFLLNKANGQKSSAVPDDSMKKKISGNAMVADGVALPSEMNASLKKYDSSIDQSRKENADSESLLGNQGSCEELDGISKTDLTQGILVGDRTILKPQVQDNAELIARGINQKSSLREKPSSRIVGKFDDEDKSDPQKSFASDKASSRAKDEFVANSKPSLAKQKSSLGEKYESKLVTKLDEMDKNKKQESMSNDKTVSRSKDDPVRGPNKDGKVPATQVQIEEKLKAVGGSSEFANRPSKNDNHDGSFKASVDNKEKIVQKLISDFNHYDAKAEGRTATASEDKSKCKLTKDPHEKLNTIEHSDINRPSKNDKLDGSFKASDGNKEQIMQNIIRDSNRCDSKAVDRTATASEDKSKRKFAKDPYETEILSSKKPKFDEKLAKFANRNSPIESPRGVSNAGSKILDITRRPEADKSKWFEGLPWEENIRSAHEDQRLVLLQNLDLSYSGTEVEDIVWHALKQNCTAKMIPHAAFSSPHSGQAFAVFKTREAAQTAITKLNKGCLMLSKGRPLVGRIANFSFPGKPSTFFGHMSIDKIRHHMQREMREAVATSHCSQPNTIEYDMALEWCFLQEQTNLEWKRLYEQHGKELTKLKAALKSR